MVQNDTFALFSRFSLNTCFKNVTQMQRKRSTDEEESVTAVQRKIRKEGK